VPEIASGVRQHRNHIATEMPSKRQRIAECSGNLSTVNPFISGDAPSEFEHGAPFFVLKVRTTYSPPSFDKVPGCEAHSFDHVSSHDRHRWIVLILASMLR
jgi:hypothetical protein